MRKFKKRNSWAAGMHCTNESQQNYLEERAQCPFEAYHYGSSSALKRIFLSRVEFQSSTKSPPQLTNYFYPITKIKRGKLLLNFHVKHYLEASWVLLVFLDFDHVTSN